MVLTAEDQRHFEDLFREHVQVVFRYAVARSDHDMAREVVSETFLVAWRRLREVPAEPRAWLLAVARRVLRTQLRGDSRRKALYEKAALQPLSAVGAHLDPGTRTPEKLAVRSAFNRLAPRDQEVLSLVAWDGLSNLEAAQVLGVTPQGFRVRLHRPRRRFAYALKAEGFPSPSLPDASGVSQTISPIKEV